MGDELVLAELLRFQRNKLGITIQQMAENRGTSKATINDHESGTLPKEDTLLFIAWHYHIALDEVEAAYQKSKAAKDKLHKARY